MAMMPRMTQPRFTPVEMAEAERRARQMSTLPEKKRHEGHERRHVRLRTPAPRLAPHPA